MKIIAVIKFFLTRRGGCARIQIQSPAAIGKYSEITGKFLPIPLM